MIKRAVKTLATFVDCNKYVLCVDAPFLVDYNKYVLCIDAPFFSEHSLVACTCIYALYTHIQLIMTLNTEAVT
jgi:hypothetical protein